MKGTFKFLFAAFLLSPFQFMPAQASAPADSTQFNSLIEHLLKKKMPKSVDIDFILRSSFNANFTEGQSENAGAAFKFNHVMMAMRGNVTDKLSYSFRYRFSRNYRYDQLENLANSIDVAFINYKFSPKTSITVGKQTLLVGGFEYDEHPVNVYEFSNFNANQPCYMTGINFSVKPKEGQELLFQLVNNRLGTSEEAYGILPEGMKESRFPLYYSMAWNGNFCNDHLTLRYAASATELTRGYWGFIVGGGQRLSFNNFSIYLDALYTRSAIDYMGTIRGMAVDKEEVAWNGIAKNTDYVSVISEAHYRFSPMWKLRLKGYYDHASIYKENEIFTAGKYLSRWGCQGALEFYPMKDDNLHLYLNTSHKFYKKIEDKPIAAQPNQYHVSVGFIYMLPIL